MKQVENPKEQFVNDPEFQELLQRLESLHKKRALEGIKARKKVVS